MNDRAGKAGIGALVQKHRVENVPGRRAQTKRDVRDSERGLNTWICRVESANRFDRLEAIAPSFILAGGNRKGQGVDDDVVERQTPVFGEVANQAIGNGELRLGGSGLALFVDGKCNHGCPVLFDNRHDSSESRVSAIAIFVVDRVDHRAAAQALEPGFENGWFGRIENQRKRGRGGQTAHQLARVANSIAAYVIDAHVEQVGAFASLRLGDLETFIPVFG